MMDSAPHRPSDADWPAAFCARADLISGSQIDSSISLLQAQRHPIISFAMGSPCPEAIPTEAIRTLTNEVLDEDAVAALSYGPTEGESRLRAALARLLAGTSDAATPEQLLITAGATQGIDLFCKLFLGEGDLVVAESPTYTNGTAIIRGYGGEISRCTADSDGLVVDDLAKLLKKSGRQPKIIYTIPNFQNPNGSVLPLERRHALLRLAEQVDALILEDDPYGLLYFNTPSPPSLWQLDSGHRRVIAVRSFSKILAAGLRVGWVQAPASVIAKMVAAKQGMDTCTSVVSQRVIARFIDQNLLPAHLARLRVLYAERCRAMDQALRARFGRSEGFAWSVPKGGFFLWLELPANIDAEALFPIALEHGVAFIPGSAFVGPGQAGNAMRLCFASADTGEIDEGVARLATAIERLQSGPVREVRR